MPRGEFLGVLILRLWINVAQEMEHYLDQIKSTWDYITGGESQLCSATDISTVAALEGRCPADPNDRAFIESRRVDLFPNIQDAGQRAMVWQRILAINRLIPSLHTFLEDTKYLEVCAKVVKQLLPVRFASTVREAFAQLHNGQTSVQIQTKEHTKETRIENTSDDAHFNAYRQLWLFAMRHFAHMIGHPPRTENPRSGTQTCGLENFWWHSLTDIAKMCGYQHVRSKFTSLGDADLKMTEDFVRHVRPMAVYRLEPVKFNQITNKIAAILEQTSDFQELEHAETAPSPVGADLSHRCGIPFWQSYIQDRDWLFFDRMHRKPDANMVVTSLMIKTTMFNNFFGNGRYRADNVPPGDDIIGVDSRAPGGSLSSPPEEQFIGGTLDRMSVELGFDGAQPSHGASAPMIAPLPDNGEDLRQRPSLSTATRRRRSRSLSSRRLRAVPPPLLPQSCHILKKDLHRDDVVKFYNQVTNEADSRYIFVLKENDSGGLFTIFRYDSKDTAQILGRLDTESHRLPVPQPFKKQKYTSLKTYKDANSYCVIAAKEGTELRQDQMREADL